MMILSAASRYSTLLPTPDDGTMWPSSVMRAASTMAKSSLPKKPSETCCAECDRCMSAYFISPALIFFRMIGSDWYGMRKRRASASARTPSQSGAVDAPVYRSMADSSPRAWASLARSAMAVGISFG